MRNRFVSGLVSVVLCLTMCFGALAESAGFEVAPMVIEMGESRVSYPQLKSLPNEAVMALINGDIVVSGKISSHIVTLGTLVNSVFTLNVSYREYHDGYVFSVALDADGKQPDGRNGHSWAGLSYDLATGKRLSLDQLFTNPDEAVLFMEQLAEESLGAEMSEYMDFAQLSPLPRDNFYLDRSGITFFYPADQFKLVSGRAGACHFFYEEVADYLLTDETGLPAQMGILPQVFSDKDAASAVRQTVEDGVLPGVNATLGQPMTDLVEAGRLLRQPDSFPGGRYFLLEAPEYRGVYLISDDMQSGYDHSVLKGVQLRRGSLGGMVIGQSRQDDWLRILGQPDETILFTENMAYDYQLPQGQSDVYFFGDHELRLHTDVDGMLCAIQLNQ